MMESLSCCFALHFVEDLNVLDSLKDGDQSLHYLRKNIKEVVLETACPEG